MMLGEDKKPGNIILSGFDLEPVEMDTARKIIESHAKKLSEICSYEKLCLTLKTSQHGKAFLHELKTHVNLKSGNPIIAEDTDYNLYTAISKIMEKIIKQARHNSKC